MKSFIDLYPKKSKKEINNEIRKSSKIWKNYVDTKNELYTLKLLKTFKQPESGYAEWIVSKMYNGNLHYKSNYKYYDIECKVKRIEVKSISRQGTISKSYKISEKDRNNDFATHYAFVIFQEFIPDTLIMIETIKIKLHPLKSISIKEMYRISEETHDLSCLFII